MSELASRSLRSLQDFWSIRLLPNGGRLALLFGLVLLLSATPELTELVTETMAEAYLQVSVFVALTLTVFYAVERACGSTSVQSWRARWPGSR